MEIKVVPQSDFANLLRLMNLAFGFKKRVDKFEHILPKLYKCYSNKNFHLGVYENGVLVSSLGLYPLTTINNNNKLNLLFIGGVSTHPDYRNKGYFTKLIGEAIAYAKKNKFDLLFLGGNRTRYGRFGFECAGSRFIFFLDGRKKINDKKPFAVSLMSKAPIQDVKECLNFYLHADQHCERKLDEFLTILKSWNGVPYIVYSNNKVIGYFTLHEGKVFEYNYKMNYQYTLFKAMLSVCPKVNIYGALNDYNPSILKICDEYRFDHCGKAYIINEDNICAYMGILKKIYSKLKTNKLNNKTQLLFGDHVKRSIGNSSFYIYYPDCC